MRFLASAGLMALLAVSLHADIITSESLSMTVYGNSSESDFSGGGTELDSGLFTTDSGWVGSASVITNVGGIGSFNLPITLDLTNLTATCENEAGCGYLEVDFGEDLQLAGSAPDLYAPYSVSVTGSGADLDFFYSISPNGLGGAGDFDYLNGGTYSFSEFGSLVSNGPVGNQSIRSSLDIVGGILPDALGGNFGDVFSLPGGGGVQIQLGASEVASTPEPGTLSLAGAFFLLSGLTAWGWRRRTAAPRKS